MEVALCLVCSETKRNQVFIYLFIYFLRNFLINAAGESFRASVHLASWLRAFRQPVCSLTSASPLETSLLALSMRSVHVSLGSSRQANVRLSANTLKVVYYLKFRCRVALGQSHRQPTGLYWAPNCQMVQRERDDDGRYSCRPSLVALSSSSSMACESREFPLLWLVSICLVVRRNIFSGSCQTRRRHQQFETTTRRSVGISRFPSTRKERAGLSIREPKWWRRWYAVEFKSTHDFASIACRALLHPHKSDAVRASFPFGRQQPIIVAKMASRFDQKSLLILSTFFFISNLIIPKWIKE